MLNPQNGSPITLAFTGYGSRTLLFDERTTLDWPLKADPVKGDGKRFYSPEEVVIAYNEGQA